MNEQELESLGYRVKRAEDILEPIFNITMSWTALKDAPEQIDLYFLSGEYLPSAEEDFLKFAHRIGSVYPKPNKAGRQQFAYRMLSKKGRFAFEPPIVGFVKINVARLTPVYYTVECPGGTNRISGHVSAKVAWKKAGEIELAGGFEYYVDAMNEVG